MIPTPINEPVLSYSPGTPERDELKRVLKELSARVLEIPVVVGGREVRTGKTVDAVMPHCHRHVLAKVHQAGPKEIEAAIAAAREAWRDWSAWPLERRAAVFLKAADLLATRHRAVVNAATMLGQSKTAHQLARRVDFRLVRGLGLPQHRRRVHHRAVARGEEIGGLEEHGRPPLQGPRGPLAPRLARRRDRAFNLLGARLVHLGQHVVVAVGHDGIDGLPGADLAATDDDGDVQYAGGQLFEDALQLVALRSAG